jgi:hypothetical protein
MLEQFSVSLRQFDVGPRFARIADAVSRTLTKHGQGEDHNPRGPRPSCLGLTATQRRVEHATVHPYTSTVAPAPPPARSHLRSLLAAPPLLDVRREGMRAQLEAGAELVGDSIEAPLAREEEHLPRGKRDGMRRDGMRRDERR